MAAPSLRSSLQQRKRAPVLTVQPGGALRGAERALDRHDIPDGSLAARSAGVIVSFQSRLSLGAGSCPSTAHPVLAHGLLPPVDTPGSGRAPHGLAVARGSCSISGPMRPKAGGHVRAMARSWRPPLGTLAPGSEPLSLPIKSTSPPESPWCTGLSHEAGWDAPLLPPAQPHAGVRAGRAA